MQPHTTVFKICRRCRQSLPRDSEHFGYANGVGGRYSATCLTCYEKTWARLRGSSPLDSIETARPPVPENLSDDDDFAFPEVRTFPASSEYANPHGFVYILASATGQYKIGRTSDVRKRYASFLKLPIRFRMVHWIECDDCFDAEATIHNYFRRKRAVGEWFNLTAADVVALQTASYLPRFTGTDRKADARTLAIYCRILPTPLVKANSFVFPNE